MEEPPELNLCHYMRKTLLLLHSLFSSLAINLCCTNNNSLADLIVYLMAQNKRVERLDSHGRLAQAANFGNFEFQAGFVACHCVLSVIN